MPRQGNTVESCVLVGWRVAEGARVRAQDVLCEVETDKAVFEVAAGADGLVLKLLAAVGDDVPVLAPIAVIGEAGENWAAAVGGAPSAAASTAPLAATAEPAPTPSTPTSAASTANAGRAAIGVSHGVSPRARALAGRETLDATLLSGSGPGGRVIERDVRAALDGHPPLSASARAAVAATGTGATRVAIPALGSGPGATVLVGDLGRAGPVPAQSPAAQAVPAAASTIPAAVGAGFPGPFSETPIRSIRKVIAERMRESLATTAQYTLHAAAPATRLLELRARLKAAPEGLGLSAVTVGDVVLYVTARVLMEHPLANSRKEGEVVRTFERVHLGLAVDTPRGLMVPVIRNADLLSLGEISAEAKRIANACIAGSISPDELSGSTFTVSNLGALGVEYFTPVINAPEVCVLGVGSILPKPMTAADGTIAFAPAIGLSLTSDHQVVDGAPAARLLRDLCAAISVADLWLAR
jgi:pyruvate dehydrogenase E2 component (dihydrolipoamide acetyltransferase)